MTRARRKFQQQLKKYQNLQTKIDCIEEAAEEVYGKSSQAVWHDLIKETTRLTRLTDFNQYCQSLGLDPSNVAQHIVFAGSGVISKIWRDGDENVLGSMVYDYSEPLVDMLKISGKTISIPKMKLKSVAAVQLMTAVTSQEEVTLVEATEKSTDEETAA